MIKTLEVDLEFAPTIPGPPVAPKQLLRTASGNDEVTIDSWRETWIANTKRNHELKGPFGKSGIGQLFGYLKGEAAICVGSGPSLKVNVADLVEASKHLAVISCLHNFHFLEDAGVDVDFYVTLDAGNITVTEVYEGGARTPEEYWAMTKSKTLLAFVGACPELIEKWQGKIYWFNSPIPNEDIVERMQAVEVFTTMVSTGGNVLGAAFYAAKAIMAANPIIFAGADFSFSYDKKFHGWDSKYDATLGAAFKVTDIFGNRRYTWQSYFNFKCWFDFVCCSVPGIYINATEGGCLGAYDSGNIAQIIQTSLEQVVKMYSHSEFLRDRCENPGIEMTKENPPILLF